MFDELPTPGTRVEFEVNGYLATAVWTRFRDLTPGMALVQGPAEGPEFHWWVRENRVVTVRDVRPGAEHTDRVVELSHHDPGTESMEGSARRAVALVVEGGVPC